MMGDDSHRDDHDPLAPATDPAGGAGSRSGLLAVVKLAVVALTIYLVARVASTVGWSDFRREIADASPLPVTLAAVALLARWWIWQHRWSLGLELVAQPTRARRRFAALTASILANLVTPTARVLGGVLRARYFSRPWGGPFSRVFASVLFDQLMHNAVIGVYTWLALIGAAWVLDQRWLSLVATGAFVAAGALLYRRASRLTARDGTLDLTSPFVAGPRRTIERLGNFADHGRETLRVLRAMLGNRSLLARSSAWTTVLFAANVSAQWLLFLALGSDLAFLKVAAVVGLGGFAGALLATPGGIGSTEAAMIAMFVALGVPQVDAVAAVLLYRGLHYGLVFACGLPSLAVLEWQRRRLPGVERTE
jgi:uncharacterized protein (TIRG00374 family)